MIRLTTALLITAAWSAAAISPAAAIDALPAIHDGPSEPARAWSAAMEAGDMAALARMLGPETTAFPPGQTELDGPIPIMKGYASLFADFTVRVRTEDAHWIESGPLVVSWGLTTLTLHPRGGGADIVSHTRFTDAALRVGSGWHYVIDHASVPKAR